MQKLHPPRWLVNGVHVLRDFFRVSTGHPAHVVISTCNSPYSD
jgi:hypothetical protein